MPTYLYGPTIPETTAIQIGGHVTFPSFDNGSWINSYLQCENIHTAQAPAKKILKYKDLKDLLDS